MFTQFEAYEDVPKVCRLPCHLASYVCGVMIVSWELCRLPSFTM